MSPENSQILFDRYAELFTNGHNMPISLFGIECRDGWFKIIDDCLGRLKPIIIEKNREYPVFPIKVEQIKEKFGQLRIYLTGYIDPCDEAIRDAEEKAAQTCELCGAKGCLRLNGFWYTTLCDECQGKRSSVTVTPNGKSHG